MSIALWVAAIAVFGFVGGALLGVAVGRLKAWDDPQSAPSRYGRLSPDDVRRIDENYRRMR